MPVFKKPFPYCIQYICIDNLCVCTGHLPPEWRTLTGFSSLYLAYNRLSGNPATSPAPFMHQKWIAAAVGAFNEMPGNRIMSSPDQCALGALQGRCRLIGQPSQN